MIRGFRPLLASMALAVAIPFAGCVGGDSSPANVPGPKVEDALPNLVRSLKGRGSDARARAAVSIGRMGPAAKAAVPELTAALKDRDVAVKAAAAHALGKIGPDARSALPELEHLAKQAALREVVTTAVEEISK